MKIKEQVAACVCVCVWCLSKIIHSKEEKSPKTIQIIAPKRTRLRFSDMECDLVYSLHLEIMHVVNMCVERSHGGISVRIALSTHKKVDRKKRKDEKGIIG